MSKSMKLDQTASATLATKHSGTASAFGLMNQPISEIKNSAIATPRIRTITPSRELADSLRNISGNLSISLANGLGT